MEIGFKLLTERLCLSAPLELCRVDIYTQPVDEIMHMSCGKQGLSKVKFKDKV